MASKASKQIRKGLRIHVTVLACIPDGDPMVESCEDARTWPKPTHRDCARVGRAAERLFGSCLADVELAFRQLPYSRLRFLPHQPHRPCMHGPVNDLPLSSPTSKLRCYPCHRGPTSASEMAIPRRCFRHRAEGISIPGSRYVVLASDCFWAVTQTNTLRIDNHISN